MPRILILAALLLIAAAPDIPTPGPYPGPTSYPGPVTPTPVPHTPTATFAAPTPTRTPLPSGTPVCDPCQPTAVTISGMETRTEGDRIWLLVIVLITGGVLAVKRRWG